MVWFSQIVIRWGGGIIPVHVVNFILHLAMCIMLIHLIELEKWCAAG